MEFKSAEHWQEETPTVAEEIAVEQPMDTAIPGEAPEAHVAEPVERPEIQQEVSPETPMAEPIETVRAETAPIPETEIPECPPHETVTPPWGNGGTPYVGSDQGYAPKGYAYGNPNVGAYPPQGNRGNPYRQGYYGSTSYNQGYGPGQSPYYGGNYVPLMREAAYAPPVAYQAPAVVVRKNNKTVASLILGILAVGVLNYIPFVALVLSIIGICMSYTGLKQGELTKGKRICGYIGLGLGIICLILSVTMLAMLLSMFVKAINSIGDYANSIIG